jgi:hypothetical protein
MYLQYGSWLSPHMWRQLTQQSQSQSQCYFTTAVYRQSVRLSAKSLEVHDQRFFFQLKSCSHSPCVTSSLTSGWVCLLWVCLAFLKYTRIYRTYSMPLKILSFALYQSRLCRADHDILFILCYNDSLVTWTVVSLTTAKFKSKSESELLYDWRFTAHSVLGAKPFETRSEISFFATEPLRS